MLLIDEAPAAGGQIYRKVPDALLPARHDDGDPDPDRRAGDALRRELNDSGTRTAFGWRVWSVMRSERGFRLDAISDGGVHAVEASGTVDRDRRRSSVCCRFPDGRRRACSVWPPRPRC